MRLYKVNKSGYQYWSSESAKILKISGADPGYFLSIQDCIIIPPNIAPKQSIASISPSSSPIGGGLVTKGILLFPYAYSHYFEDPSG